MLSLTARKPLDRWNFARIHPGPVGSVGDANVTPMLNSTFPGDFEFDSKWGGDNEPKFGSNVSDGMKLSYTSRGGPGRTFDNFFGGQRDFKTERGWQWTNLRPEDRADEAVVGETPQISWRMNVADIKNSRRTGNLFNFPKGQGGFVNAPTGTPRGGLVPSVVASENAMPGFMPYVVDGLGGGGRRRGGSLLPFASQTNTGNNGVVRGRESCRMRDPISFQTGA
jgi:hypothetical protein